MWYTAHKPIVIEIENLTKDMVDWYMSMGGKCLKDEFFDKQGKSIIVWSVGYGKGKFCHHRKDGTKGVRLHFNEEDANIATLFIMKFAEYVQTHNIRQEYFN